MLTIATWVLAAAVAGGLGLAALWLLERPPNTAMRVTSVAHGIAAASGTALVAVTVFRGAPDGQNFGHLTSWFLLTALAGGLLIIAAQLRRRRPSGLVVILHASIGVAGFVLLVAYRSIMQ